MNRKIEVGDIFKIDTAKGIAFLQLVKLPKNKNEVTLLRVFSKLNLDIPKDLNNVLRDDYYFLKWPLKAALKDGLVLKIGNIPLPEGFELPKYFRTENAFGDGWNIIGVEEDKYIHVGLLKLSDEQRKYSPWDIIAYPDLVEMLENNWRPETWEL